MIWRGLNRRDTLIAGGNDENLPIAQIGCFS